MTRSVVAGGTEVRSANTLPELTAPPTTPTQEAILIEARMSDEAIEQRGRKHRHVLGQLFDNVSVAEKQQSLMP